MGVVDPLWQAGILPIAGDGPRPILDRWGIPVDLSLFDRPDPRKRRSLDLSSVPDWLRDAVAAGHICAHPVVVRSQGEAGRIGIDTTTGEILAVDGGDRSFVRPCGNRRAAACPHCSERYRRDLYRVAMSELSTDVPLTFATLTADGMAVDGYKTCPHHTGPRVKRRKDGTDKVEPRECSGCGAYHPRGSDLIGAPLDPARFEYRRAASFNAASGALLTAWVRLLKRKLRTDEYRRQRKAGASRDEARAAALDASAVKVLRCAELQDRGVVHHHLLLPGIWSADLLRAITNSAAVSLDGYRHQYSPRKQGCHVVHKYPGDRLDGSGDPGRMYAAYLGKYVCKSSSALVESAAGPVAMHYDRLSAAVCDLEDERADDELSARYRDDDDYADRVVAAGQLQSSVLVPGAVTDDDGNPVPPGVEPAPLLPPVLCSAERPDGSWDYAALLRCKCIGCVAWRRKRRALEYLGMRGHVFTRSRSWSLSFSSIRSARREWREAMDAARRGDDPPTVYGVDGYQVTGAGLSVALAVEDGLEQLIPYRSAPADA